MNIETLTAPMHYVDGVPAYKYGEWNGHKSCKFGPTRMMVRQIPNQPFSLNNSKLILIKWKDKFILCQEKRKFLHGSINHMNFDQL